MQHPVILIAAIILAVGLAAYIMQIVRLSPEARPNGRDPNWADIRMVLFQIVGGGLYHTASFAAVFAICWALALVLR